MCLFLKKNKRYTFYQFGCDIKTTDKWNWNILRCDTTPCFHQLEQILVANSQRGVQS